MAREVKSFRVGKVAVYLRGKVWYLCYYENGRRRRPRAGPDREACPYGKLDPRGTPGGVLAGRALDQLADLHRGPRSAAPVRARLPAPVEPEALAVPADDRFGLDDHQARAPVRPEAGQPHPEDPVTLAQLGAVHRTPKDTELVPEGQILGGQGRSGEDERAEEAEDQPYHVDRVASVRVA